MQTGVFLPFLPSFLPLPFIFYFKIAKPKKKKKKKKKKSWIQLLLLGVRNKDRFLSINKILSIYRYSAAEERIRHKGL